MPEEYAKNKYYAKLDTGRYQYCRETLYCIDLCQSHWNMKCRSRSQCMLEEIMPGKITMQGLTFTAITATEECTLPVTNHTN